MTIGVSAVIPEDSISSAAFGLGMDLTNVSRSGIVRAALALYHGADRIKAKEYVMPKRMVPARLGSDGQDFVSAQIPNELYPEDIETSLAIRIGLAMAAGMPRKQAENWAKMTVRSVGRPRKMVNDDTN